MADVFLLCKRRDILCSIENPGNSWMWSIWYWKQILEQHSKGSIYFHNCMHGGTRNKLSLWQCTDSTLAPLAAWCDASHVHEPWGLLRSGNTWAFATALECEYPLLLCRRVGQLVYGLALSKGALPQAVQLGESGLTSAQRVKQLRTAAGKLPRGQKLPPLVSEYLEVRKVPFGDCSLLPPHKILREFTERGVGGQKFVAAGIYRSPLEFFNECKSKSHPMDMKPPIDDCIKRAIFNLATLGPACVTQRRADYLKVLLAKAKEFERAEATLHSSLPAHIAGVLKGKRLLLLQWALKDAGFADVTLVDEIVAGFRMTGTTAASHTFPSRLRPAAATEEELRKTAVWKRRTIDSELRTTGDPSLDKAIWELCLEEAKAEWIVGPLEPEEVTKFVGSPCWLPNRRFGLQQGPKLRLIDDCKKSEVNQALTTTERLNLMDLDFLVAIGKFVMDLCGEHGSIHVVLDSGEALVGKLHTTWGPPSEWVWLGRTLDLQAAYKQLALHPSSLWCAVLATFNPVSARPAYFVSQALLFGSTASVYAFNRLARGLWHLAVTKLMIVASNFYDDFPVLEPALTSTSARSAFESMLTILGVSYATTEKKSKPHAAQFEALGVVVDLSELHLGRLLVTNKVSRIRELIQSIEGVLTSSRLRSPEANELAGRMHYAASNVFGFAAKPALRVLQRHAASMPSSKQVTAEVRSALQFLIKFLNEAKPRSITKKDVLAPIIVLTDGACEGDQVTCGAVVFDVSSGACYVFGGHCPPDIVAAWRATSGEQVICQAELYPMVLARHHFKELMRDRRVLYFVDNNAARDSSIRGDSDSLASRTLLSIFHAADISEPAWHWFSRVPTHSNIADDPSRLKVRDTATLLGAQIIEVPVLAPEFIAAILSSR